MSKYIFLTGPPGIGKSTIIQKVCFGQLKYKVNIKGFYTKEIRQNGKRIGFDVVCFREETQIKEEPLARICEQLGTSERSGPKVGNYYVNLESFENAVLPILKSQINNMSSSDELRTVLVLDEIGKMELMSEKFEKCLHSLLFTDGSLPRIIFGTIPTNKSRNGSIQIVEKIRNDPNVLLYTVTAGNRDLLPAQIEEMILKSIK